MIQFCIAIFKFYVIFEKEQMLCSFLIIWLGRNLHRVLHSLVLLLVLIKVFSLKTTINLSCSDFTHNYFMFIFWYWP